MFRVKNISQPICSEFEQLIQDAGMVLFQCDSNGSLKQSTQSHWLTDLLRTSPMVRAAIRTHCLTWNTTQNPEPVEAVAGIWLIPLRTNANKRDCGYIIGVVVTEEIMSSEYLFALCQASNADKTVISSMIQALPPASTNDIHRLSCMFQFAWNAQSTKKQDQKTIESVGQELADSYEEISLLYTITSNMNSVNHPERFIELACEELLQTLPYTWIGVQLYVGDRLPRPGEELIVAGDIPMENNALSDVIQQTVKSISTHAPLVSNGEDVISNRFGQATIIEPIVSDGTLIGVLIAANKQGEDTTASSVDIKLLSATAAQLGIFLENAMLYEDLNATFLGTLEALTSSIDAKDQYTCGHSQRVALLTAQLAQAAGLDEDQINRYRIAGLVHDIGKIGVPEAVLLKKGDLTKDEFDKIQKHPEIGARILKDIPQMGDILGGVLHHHEKFDGTGYPHGLSGNDIPQVARMIALADTFDAMSSSRTYRMAMTRVQVLDEMKHAVGTQFDPSLCALFFNLDFSQWEKLMIDHQAGTNTTCSKEAA